MSYKLLNYMTDVGPRAGLLIGKQVFDAAQLSGCPAYGTTLGILEDWDNAAAQLAQLCKWIPSIGGRDLSAVTLLAPVLFPGQIFAAGANYQDHINEMNEQGNFKTENSKQRNGRPWFFTKPSRSAVIGHGSVRALPPYSICVDWEVELAVVIGRLASRVHVSQALDYVAGYTVANDLSARDCVVRDNVPVDSPFRFDWLSHKGFDGSCPLGPWMTPAHDIPDPQALDLTLHVDDVEMQKSNTRHMIFSVAEQIAELSSRVTLYPGDVILTGTPSGVGMSRNVFLKPKQQVRLWIENIGELRHGFE